MLRLSLPLVLCLLLPWPPQALAKNDIRGVVTARPLAEAMETLELDGARCDTSPKSPLVCTYNETTSMTVHYASAEPRYVERLVYAFSFADLKKMQDRLQALYGLRRDGIEGEHKLATGERLEIELSGNGTGLVSITNDRQIEVDGGTPVAVVPKQASDAGSQPASAAVPPTPAPQVRGVRLKQAKRRHRRHRREEWYESIPY